MHWLLFIHKILFPSTCFEPQVLIFGRIQLYTCSIWYCHSLWEFLVACRYTALLEQSASQLTYELWGSWTQSRRLSWLVCVASWVRNFYFVEYDAENYAQAIGHYEMGAQAGRQYLVTSRTKLATKLFIAPSGVITVLASNNICTNEIGNLHYNNFVIHVYRVLHSTF